MPYLVNSDGKQVVKLRKGSYDANGRRIVKVLTVPLEISELLGDDEQRWFTCELTEDGILYRPSDPPGPKPKSKRNAIPGWVDKPLRTRPKTGK